MTKQYRKEFLLSFRRIRHLTRSTLPHLRALSASPRRSVVRWRWWSTSSSLSSSPPLFDIKMRIMFKETFCRRASAFFNGFSPHRMGVIRMQSSTDGGLAKDKYNSSWYVVLAAHFVPIAITRQFAFVFYSVLWPPQIAHWSHRTQTHTLSKCIEAKSKIFFFFSFSKVYSNPNPVYSFSFVLLRIKSTALLPQKPSSQSIPNNLRISILFYIV